MIEIIQFVFFVYVGFGFFISISHFEYYGFIDYLILFFLRTILWPLVVYNDIVWHKYMREKV